MATQRLTPCYTQATMEEKQEFKDKSISIFGAHQANQASFLRDSFSNILLPMDTGEQIWSFMFRTHVQPEKNICVSKEKRENNLNWKKPQWTTSQGTVINAWRAECGSVGDLYNQPLFMYTSHYH